VKFTFKFWSCIWSNCS